ncbi:hypothetical protein SAMN05216525_13081 [Bradyrhizobium sp. Gha]|nr:hypothetical protein SAMN05216525_13081 [Bradyrhizobium sp. Gha]
MLRLLQYPGRCAAFHDLAFSHDKDLICYVRDHCQIVTDQDQGLAPHFGLLEQCQDMGLRRHVESGSRLVGDKHAWI